MRRCFVFVAVFLLGGSAGAGPVLRGTDQAATVYLGAASGIDWGRPLARGDLDGDGFDEIIIGASKSYGGITSRVYVLRGGVAAHRRGTVDLAAAPADQTILGATPDDNLGASIAAGDFNGDGVDDLLLCASSADFSGIAGRGIAYVIFGGAAFFASDTRDLAADEQWDMRILGPVAGGDMGGANLFGGLDSHAAAIGDIDGDGYGDVVLGVHLADGADTQSGRVYVIFGGPYPSGYTLNLATSSGYGVRIDGRGRYDELGTIVLTGDLTGDGVAELILPCQYASQGLFTSEGAVYVFRGRATWPTSINLASTSADLTLLGARPWDELGVAAAAGDFNGDGLGDLVVAAPGADAGPYNDQQGDGFVYGLLGSDAFQTGTHTVDYATAPPDFLLIGEYQESLGDELAAGDFDADGIDDIAAAERFGGADASGLIAVVFGRDFAPGETFTAGVDTDLRIVGQANDRIGFALAASDVNGDGRSEVAFATPFNNADRGTAYVLTYVPGDVDGDADVDLSDLALLLASYGQCVGDAGYDRRTDLDGDGCTNLSDLATLLAAYGQ